MASRSTISLGIEVTGEKEFAAALRACDAETKALGAEMQRLASSNSIFDKGLLGSVSKLQNFGAQLAAQKDKLALLSSQLPKAQADLDSLAQALERAKQSGDPASIDRAATAYENQRRVVAGLEQNISQTGTAINRTRQEMTQMVSGTIHAGLERLKNGVVGIATALKDAAVAAAKAGAEIANAIVTKMDHVVKTLSATGTAIVVGLGKIAFDYNSQMENYITNFSTLLGSTEAAAKKVEELKRMAASTPFGMEDLAQATQTLLNFQVPAEKTQTILKQLGDISLGNKEKLSSLALVFGQVSSAGKLTGQDLMQFINAGFNPLNEIAKKTGESMEQLRDRMSKGGVSVKEVEEAFISATSAGGQFYNGMESASKTMTGLISTLKDNAKALIGQVFEPITNTIKDKLLPAALKYMDEITEAYTKKGLPGLVDAVTEMAGKIADVVGTKGPEIVNKVFETINQVLDKFTSALPQMVSAGTKIVESVINGFKNTLPKLGPIAAEVAPLVIKTILGYKTQLLDSGIKIISNILDGIVKEMPSIMKEMKSGLNQLLDTIATYLPKILESGGKILLSLLDGIVNNLPKLSETITMVINKIITWISENLDKIVDAGIKILAALIKGLIDSIPTLVANLPKILNAIYNGLKSGVKEVFNIGVELIKGLWEGIKSVGNWLGEKVTGFFGNLVDGVKNFLGIRSPSRLFAGIGENIGRGLANGIAGTADQVQQALDGIMPKAGHITASVDNMSVAARVADRGTDINPYQDNRPIILELNGREFGRAVRGYA